LSHLTSTPFLRSVLLEHKRDLTSIRTEKRKLKTEKQTPMGRGVSWKKVGPTKSASRDQANTEARVRTILAGSLPTARDMNVSGKNRAAGALTLLSS